VNADVQAASFNADTKLDKVDFSGANLSRSKGMETLRQVSGVVYDDRTNFPSGFNPEKVFKGGGGGDAGKKRPVMEDTPSEDEAPPAAPAIKKGTKGKVAPPPEEAPVRPKRQPVRKPKN